MNMNIISSFWAGLFTLVLAIVPLLTSGQAREALEQRHRQYLAPKAKDHSVSIRTFFGDLNGDGVSDALLEWCIDATDEDRGAGGGNALMLMSCLESGFAVYLRNGTTFRLAADVSPDGFAEPGYLPFNVESIKDGKVYCTATGYADEDPRCCPSLNGTIYLKWDGNKLVRPAQQVMITK